MAIDYANFPTYPVIPLPDVFRDDRGSLHKAFSDGFQSGAYCISKAGVIRAKHHHKSGDHLCVLMSGEMVYKWRNVGALGAANTVRLRATPESPVAFFTPPMVHHEMHFLADSVFWFFDSKVARTHESYENDLVRYTELLP